MAVKDGLGLPEALQVLDSLIEEQLALTGRLPHSVVTLGGTALAAHGVRARSEDVDVFLSEVHDDALASVETRYRKLYGPNFKIDATPVNTCWGEIALFDIDSSPTVATRVIGGHPVTVRALSIETLYVVKVAADRQKDRLDVPELAKRSTFERVVARANELFPSYADRKSFAAFVERLARAIGRDFQRPLEEVEGAFDVADSVRERLKEARQAIELQFLAALRALMNKAPHLIDFDPKTPRKLRFDAVAAGAPEEVVQVMERFPDEVADMASAALKAKDTKRHLEWILAMKRASPEPDAGEPASFKP